MRGTHLRAAYVAEPEPTAVIIRAVHPTWRIEDLSHLPSEEQDRRISAFLENDATQPFELSQPPLTRFALFRVAPEDYRFVWTHHHLEIDGWSWPIVFHEVAALYRGTATSAREAVPRLYRVAHTSSRIRRVLARTTARLPYADAASGPRKRRSGGVDRHGGHSRSAPELAQRARVTLNAICQAAWALLLAQRSSMNDIVFGAAISGRPADLDGADLIVGHFVNNLPVRARIDLSQSFTSLCGQMHAQSASLTEHQHVSLSDIQGWSELSWDPRLFTTLLVFQNYVTSDRPWQFGNVKLEDIRQRPCRRTPFSPFCPTRRRIDGVICSETTNNLA